MTPNSYRLEYKDNDNVGWRSYSVNILFSKAINDYKRLKKHDRSHSINCEYRIIVVHETILDENQIELASI